jgi:hypothetical protein
MTLTPSPKDTPASGNRKFYDHGMVPAAPSSSLSLLVIDVRQLKLNEEEAARLEEAVQNAAVSTLEDMRDMADAKLINFLSTAKGFAVE